MAKYPMSEEHEKFPLWPGGIPGPHDPSDVPSLEVFRPLVPLAHPGPGVLICPGGGYSTRVPHERENIASWFNERGWWAGIVHYRVKPFGDPWPYVDACRAMRLARKMSGDEGLRPDRLAIMGFSAGGHLAVTVATQPERLRVPEDDLARQFSARPDALVLAYPVVSFVSHGHEGSRENLLGPNPPWNLRRELSGELAVSTQTPPTFLFHTDGDPVVPVENSLQLATALRRHGVPLTLHVFPGDTHGVSLAENDPQLGAWTELLETWLSHTLPI